MADIYATSNNSGVEISKDIVATGKGGVPLNIAYGETAPSETDKLWVKASEPESFEFKDNLGTSGSGTEKIETLSATLSYSTSGLGIASVGSKIYLFGGADRNTIQVFDTTDNTIQVLSNVRLTNYAADIATCTVGTKIYLFGGHSSYDSSIRDYNYFNTIQVFDTTDNTIQVLSATLSVIGYEFNAISVGDKIYLYGGHTSKYYNNKIQVFDTTNNTIQVLSATLYSSETVKSTRIGTDLYAFGGYSWSDNRDYYYGDIQKIDTVTNARTYLGYIPNSLSRMSVCAVGSIVYLFGGRNSSGYSNIIQKYDTTTNTLTTISATLSKSSDAYIPVKLGNSIYLFLRGTVECFNADSETIEILDIQSISDTEYYMRVSSIGNNIYIFGGDTKTIQKFSASFPLPQNTAIFETGGATFDLVSAPTKVPMTIKSVYIGNENNAAERKPAYLHNGTDWVEI